MEVAVGGAVGVDAPRGTVAAGPADVVLLPTAVVEYPAVD